MAQALVPLKDLVQAKTRLAGLMNSSERRALAQAMVEDVLGVLCRHPLLEKVTLVSDDPGARMLAGKYGASYLAESSLGSSGLNQVVSAAVDQLLDTAGGTLLVLHGDLPLLGAADISAVLQCQRESGGLVIGCDRHRRGSNLLAFDERSRPRFCFGVDSCAAHQRAAEQLGANCSVLYRRGLALDVDEAMDMLELMRALDEAGEQTGALLRGTELGKRISLALTAPGGDVHEPAEESRHYD